MRAYEFINEDLAKALDTKSDQLDNQSTTIKNRKKALSNLKQQKANRDAVKNMADNAIKSK